MRGDPFHTVNEDTEKQLAKKETEMTKKVSRFLSLQSIGKNG